MTRTRLRNRFLKNRTEENKRKYTNYYVSFLRKLKVEYYSNLNEKDVTDNKMNWKTAKPFFLKKKLPLKTFPQLRRRDYWKR